MYSIVQIGSFWGGWWNEVRNNFLVNIKYPYSSGIYILPQKPHSAVIDNNRFLIALWLDKNFDLNLGI